MKQRRVSLALPSDSSPRIFPAWSFHDDTGLGVHLPDSAQAQDDATDAKKGKIRRIAGGDDALDVGDVTILNDPGSGFNGRSPVDLKDRYVASYLCLSVYIRS